VRIRVGGELKSGIRIVYIIGRERESKRR